MFTFRLGVKTIFTNAVRLLSVLVLAVGSGERSTASAQGATAVTPFRVEGPLTHRDVEHLPASSVAIDGNTAIVGFSQDKSHGDRAGSAYIFARDRGGAGAWGPVAKLTASDARRDHRFGSSVAISGDTAIVGAPGPFGEAGYAYIFRRDHGGSNDWGEVTTLSASDFNQIPAHAGISFGLSVAISGDTAVVGASRGPANSSKAYVFKRDQRDPNVWHEVRKLDPGGCIVTQVAIHKDTIVVAQCQSAAFIFDRNMGGAEAWGVAARVPVAAGPSPEVWHVAIDGDELLATISDGTGSAALFARHQGGPNAWGRVATFVSGLASQVPAVALDGDLAVVAATGPPIVFARNQGRTNGWGEVTRLTPGGVHAAISGDTILTGQDSVFAFVSDVDGDEIRDGVDPCRRDPLNASECRRSTSASQLFTNHVALFGVRTVRSGSRFDVSATFINTSAGSVRLPFFHVTELTNGNVLLNSDQGGGGELATLSPDVGDDNLSPGESMTVTFRILLQSPVPFRFTVDLWGN